MMKSIVISALLLSLEVNTVYAIEDIFCTNIDKIEKTLSNASVKRLVIGGLHTPCQDMRKIWKLSEASDIVINIDKTGTPDIMIDVFTGNLRIALSPLTSLLKSKTQLKFNEIIFEHVGNSDNLPSLMNQLDIFSDMLAPNGKYTHQSLFMDLYTPSQSSLEQTGYSQLGFKLTTYDQSKKGDIINYDKYASLATDQKVSNPLSEKEYKELAEKKKKFATQNLIPIYFEPLYSDSEGDSTIKSQNLTKEALESPETQKQLESYTQESRKIWATNKQSSLQAFYQQIEFDKTILPYFKKDSPYYNNCALYIERREVEYKLLNAFPSNKLVLDYAMNFEGLDHILPKEITFHVDGSNNYYIEPINYQKTLGKKSILIHYIAALEKTLGVKKVNLSFQRAMLDGATGHIYCFSITSTKD